MTSNETVLKDAAKDRHQLKILMLEKNPKDVLLTERVLQKSGFSFVIRAIKSSEEFARSLSEYRPDVILSDTATHEFGMHDIKKMNREGTITTPFILITYHEFEEKVNTFLKAGIDKIIFKENIANLPQVIRAVLTKRRMTTSSPLSNYRNAPYGNSHEVGLATSHLLNDFSLRIYESHKRVSEEVLELQANSTLMQNSRWKIVNEELLQIHITLQLVNKYNELSLSQIQLEEIDWEKMVTDSLKDVHGQDKTNNVRLVFEADAAPFFSDVRYMKLILDILLEILLTQNSNLNKFAIEIKKMPSNMELKFFSESSDQQTFLNTSRLIKDEFKQEDGLKLSIMSEIVFSLNGYIQTDLPHRKQGVIIIPNNLPL